MKQKEHFTSEGLPLNCGLCSSQIIGPLIRCINCPSYNLCFKCSTLADFGKAADGHSNSHICEVTLETTKVVNPKE